MLSPSINPNTRDGLSWAFFSGLGVVRQQQHAYKHGWRYVYVVVLRNGIVNQLGQSIGFHGRPAAEQKKKGTRREISVYFCEARTGRGAEVVIFATIYNRSLDRL